MKKINNNNKLLKKKEKTKENIRQTEKNIMKNEDEIGKLNEEIGELNESIEKKEKEIQDILTFYQISNGESAYLEYAFGAKTFTDFIYRAAVSEQLTSYNNGLVEQYKQEIEESKKKTKELSIKVKELEKKQQEYQTYLIKLGNDLADLHEAAVSIDSQIQLAMDMISTFEEMGCKDDETLEECARNSIPKDTGFLRPIEMGYVSDWSGNRNGDGVVVSKLHHGLDFSSRNAANIDYPVYSIANGVVIAVYDKCGNGGRQVYIQHNVNGNIYISAYWHLRRITVKKGDVVTKHDQIGIMGGLSYETGCYIKDNWTTGAHLHMEMSSANFDVNNFWAYRSGWLQPEKFINTPKSLYQYFYKNKTKFR